MTGGDHRDRSDVSEPMEGDDVDVHDGRLAFEVEFVEQALVPEPGVVDEQVDGNRCVAQAVLDARHAARVGEVGDQHLARHLDFGCQRIESSLVTGDDHQLRAVGRELAGDLAPDPRRRPGHQRACPRSHLRSLARARVERRLGPSEDA